MAAQKIGRASTLSRRRIVGTTPGGKHIAEKNIARGDDKRGPKKSGADILLHRTTHSTDNTD